MQPLGEAPNLLELAESILVDFGRSHPNSEKFEHETAVVMQRIENFSKDKDEGHLITIFPAGTHFFEPDPINRVSIMFPDQDSAIAFFEWCREQVIHAEASDVT
jgi:hypothetical protein